MFYCCCLFFAVPMMKFTTSFLVALTVLSLSHAQETTDENMENLKKEVKYLKSHLSQISRQLMLQQFFTEEKIRNDGFSGIKQLRTGLG